MQRRTSPTWSWALLLSLALAGCPDDGSSELELSCDEPFNGQDIEGTWTLTASGKREKCSDSSLRGDLTITSEEPFRIRGMEFERDASVTDADAFVDRILVRSGFELTGRSLPAKIVFDGFSEGSCVSFRITEALENDGLTYQFDGYVSEEGLIEGNFTGTGPEDCETRGRFEVEVR